MRKQAITHVKTVWVMGASGGIGAAFAAEIRPACPNCYLVGLARNPSAVDTAVFDEVHALDLLAPQQWPETLACISHRPDWLLIATGLLHNEVYQPEKTYRSLSADHLQLSFQINAQAPALLIQAVLLRFGHRSPIKIGVLSARLGSISDNQLGGWHSYRASKAALNMLIKNIAIELHAKRAPITVFAIQPGTTDTRLSQPFQKHLPPGQLQSAEFTAQKIQQLFVSADGRISGLLIDFEGHIISP